MREKQYSCCTSIKRCVVLLLIILFISVGVLEAILEEWAVASSSAADIDSKALVDSNELMDLLAGTHFMWASIVCTCAVCVCLCHSLLTLTPALV